jgi:hypothetical protein
MKVTDYLRWVLTVALLYFVWKGHPWAIKLTITALVVTNEVVCAAVSRLVKIIRRCLQ